MKRIIIFKNSEYFDTYNFDTPELALQALMWLREGTSNNNIYKLC